MKTSLALLSLGVLAMVAACGKSDSASDGSGGSSSSRTLSYTYSFNDNGCKTDKHSFASIEAYCNGLRDEALNNGCARTMRKNSFQQAGCPGSF